MNINYCCSFLEQGGEKKKKKKKIRGSSSFFHQRSLKVAIVMSCLLSLAFLSRNSLASSSSSSKRIPQASAFLLSHRYKTRASAISNRISSPGLASLVGGGRGFIIESSSSSANNLRWWNISRKRFSPPPTTTTRLQLATKTAAASATTTTKKKGTSNRPYRLVIVESPSKCKTIEKILNQYVTDNQLEYDFVVTSCYGHIRNLPKNNQQLKNAKYSSTTASTTSASNDEDSNNKFPYTIVGVDLANDYQPTYVLLEGKEKLLKELQDLSSHAQQVYLATDPDREGEAIAWHLQQVLDLPTDMAEQQQQRLCFTEITPTAIVEAIERPQTLNINLVHAQETRRILDRLAGFTVSPVLWKKIAPGLSAGRVQSVGMALCVQRERQRLVFQPQQYYDIIGNFSISETGMSVEDSLVLTSDEDNYLIPATLTAVNGTSLVAGKADFVVVNEGDGDGSNKEQQLPKPNKRLLTQEDAEELTKRLFSQQDDEPLSTTTKWNIVSVQGRERTTNPSEPFKTSTLQQESNHRLGMGVSQTMRMAQMLYEGGYISYMRTDSTQLSNDAHATTKQAISERHGPKYVNVNNVKSTTTKKKKKTKSEQSDKVAQEAHEAIRPAIQSNGRFADPEEVGAAALPDVAKKLYNLIYRRTLASRMIPQISNQTTVIIQGTTIEGDVADFKATGSVILEPGFTLEWNRGGSNGNGDTTTTKALPPLQEGQDMSCHDLEPQSHTTQPPPRYTEASLVKELEALGVGRPSTYAGIVQILRDRAYVGSPTSAESSDRSSSKRGGQASGAAITAQRAAGGGDLFGARGPLAPSLSAFVVTSLLEQHCPTYVDPSFTAHMEENLDRIARGTGDDDEDDDDGDSDSDAKIVDVAQQRVAYLNEFYAGEKGLAAQIKRIDDEVDAEDARRAHLPALEVSSSEEDDDDDDSSSEDIGIYIGPWGPYIQQKDGSSEPVKASLPPGMATDLSTITPGTLKVLVQNKQSGTVLGQHPDDGRNIYLRVGRFGAYLQWGEPDEEGTSTHSLPKHLSAMRNLRLQPAATDPPKEDDDESEEDVPTESPEDSAACLGGMLGITLEEAIGYCRLPRTITTLEEKPITAAIGPYGPYLKWNSKYTSLRSKDGDVLTVDEETAKQLVIDGIINKKTGAARNVLAELGEMEGDMVSVKSGRFGNYINWRKVNAKLPPEFEDEPDSLPLEQAWALIEEKAAQAPKTKKSRSKKKEIDLPPAPKRPLSSYMHFCAAKRPEVAQSGKSLGEVAKELGSMWSEISEADRKQYDDLAEAGKEKYQEEKAIWESECRKLQGGKSTKRSSSVSDPSAPKRARSAYIYFCNAKRPEVSKRVTKLGDISKELARMWAETTDRSEYIALAEADKERYEREKAAHKQGKTASITTKRESSSKVKGVPKRVRVVGGTRSTKSRRKSPSTTTKKRGKRAPSAYMIFCRETRHEIVDENGDKLPLGETTKRLAQRWKECDPDTRAKFDAMAAAEKENLLVSG